MSDLHKQPEEIKRMDEMLKNGFQTEQIKFEDSGLGKQFFELQNLRQDFDSYVRKQEAEQKAQEERQRVERKRNLFVSLVAGSLTGIVSGIFMYYWPTITAFVSSIIH